MKIIINNYKEYEPKQITCNKCKSILEYTKEDITKRTITEFTFPNMPIEAERDCLICPCCEGSIFL